MIRKENILSNLLKILGEEKVGLSQRREFLNELSERIGFPINEENLSPKLRSQITGEFKKIRELREEWSSTNHYMNECQIKIKKSFFKKSKDKHMARYTFFFKRVSQLTAQIFLIKDSLSKDIFKELEKIHSSKIEPTIKHVTIDFNKILDIANDKGLILKTVRCPYCDSPLDLPEQGELTKCKFCHNAVHATRIYDMLKDVLE